MRLKALIATCVATVAAVAALTGCSSSEPYTPPETTPAVSSPAIIEDGVLHVGVNASAAPLAGKNSSGDLVGFDVALAAALADALGLKVEVTDVGANGASALSQGNVAIVLGVEQDSSSASVWESDPYLQTGIALFAADANAQVPTKESAPKIAVQTSSTSSWLAENEFGAEALVRVNGLADAFTALGGQAQYAAADAVRGTYVLSDDSLGVDASIIALMQQPSGYCVALLDSNSQLKQAGADAPLSACASAARGGGRRRRRLRRVRRRGPGSRRGLDQRGDPRGRGGCVTPVSDPAPQTRKGSVVRRSLFHCGGVVAARR